MKLKFSARFLKAPDVQAGFVEVPRDIETALGNRGRVKVHAWINGAYYRGSLVRMEKGGCLLLGVTKKVKAEAGIEYGQIVNIEIKEDTDERKVEVPSDLAGIFSTNPRAYEFFQKLSYTNQKEYVVWISGARREETRQSRLEKTLDLLLNGRKNPTDKA